MQQTNIDFLARVLECKSPQHQSLADLESRNQEVRRGILALEEERKTLFGIEIARLAEINESINELNNIAENLKSKLEHFHWVQDARTKYTCITMEPLTWRDGSGLPQVVTISIDGSKFRLSAVATRLYVPEIDPPVPGRIMEHYNDVLPHLASTTHGRVLICNFGDRSIPEEVRPLIVEAQSQWFEKDNTMPGFGIVGGGQAVSTVFVLGQHNNWVTDVENQLKDENPLVAGWSYKDPEHLYIITDFNRTLLNKSE